MSNLTRITINLDQRAVEARGRIMARTGMSSTDTINAALRVLDVVGREAVDDRVTLLRPDGGTVVVVLP